MRNDISIAVLCGGKSVRFGSNKALHKIDGKPMYRHVLDKVSGLTDDVFLQVGTGNASLPERTNEDIFPDVGPLGGIVSALDFAAHDRIFVIACDMLFFDIRMFDELALLSDADIVVPRWRDGKTEPLCATYSKHVEGIGRRLLSEGHSKVSSLFLRAAKTAYLEIEPLIEQGRVSRDCFVNINSPGDLPGSG